MKTARANAPNVILITIDALRRDHLGCYGYHRNTSPSIDKLASKGALFLQAISNGGGTFEAFSSIFGSILPPVSHNQYRKVIKKNLTITELLKQSGYNTAAFHSNPWLSRYFNYDKGFDIFDDSMKLGASLQQRQSRRVLSKSTGRSSLLNKLFNLSILLNPPFTRAEKLNRKAIAWLQTNQKPFFLWVHYMDTHHPYMPLAKYRNQFCYKPMSHLGMLRLLRSTSMHPDNLSEDKVNKLIGLYDASIKYIDDAIGLLLKKLQLDKTLVIIAADHGEALGERGRIGHSLLYEEVIHIPLIIAGPGIQGGLKFRRMVNSLDIAPTIADVLNLDDAGCFQGMSLRHLISGRTGKESTISVALGQRKEGFLFSYRTEKWKYIQTMGIGKELYDLESDPSERFNLYEEGKAKEFESAISEFISRSKEVNEHKQLQSKIQKLKKSGGI